VQRADKKEENMTHLRVIPAAFVFLLLACTALPANHAPLQAEPAAPMQQAQQAPPLPASAPTAAPAETEKEVKSYTLPPDLYEKAEKLSRARYTLYFVDLAWGILVLLVILWWRLGPKYRDWAERGTSRRFLQAAIFAPLLLLTMAVLGLPTGIYGQWLERSYGLSVQGWGSWFRDWAVAQALTLILGTLFVWILYGVIRRSARRWWFYFWLASLPILLFVFFISPLVIDPLFNKFEPLESKDPPLVMALEKVVQRGGMVIPPERMFWMNASAKTKELNAYVTGFGASKRVVVWDTTIARMTSSQTAFVFGHEMGHYVLNHVPKGLAFFSGLLLVLFYLGFRAIHGLLARHGSRWGIRGVDDWASLPALLMLLMVLVFLATPLVNAFSRYQEHQADQYGLEVTHGLFQNSSQEAARAFQALGEVSLSDPDPNPFIRFWLYTHPPIGERVQFSLTYDPWSKGEQPEFVK
jgi:Zn-dependent protease with chaperone function